VEHVYYTFPFYIGLGVILLYAWHRFDEPSFPKEETLPSAVVPLRYLFLRPSYGRARLVYVGCSGILFFVLVLAGRPVLEALGVGESVFPPAAWPLTIALLMVGLMPNPPPQLKWLTAAEDRLRRQVHAWFFVPDGVKETIAVLHDADYTPPRALLEAVQEPLQSSIREGLALPRTDLRYRWSRAVMLMEVINQMGNGLPHPLATAHFEAFKDDHKELSQSYQTLQAQIEAHLAGQPSDHAEAALKDEVNRMLRRIYAYLSWGVRHQAQSDGMVFAKLAECGFRVPAGQGRRVFDVIVPALLLVMTLVFIMNWIIDRNTTLWAVGALTSAIAATFMYGGSSWITLSQRAQMIEATTWDPDSPRCFVGMAWRAGLSTWAVIVGVTVFFGFESALGSIKGLWSAAAEASALDDAALWLPSRVVTAAPWFLVGAGFSVLLASRLDGDVRRVAPRDRAVDAAIIGGGLAVAVMAAFIIQDGLEAAIRGSAPASNVLVPLLLAGLTGLLVGAVIGFVVPRAFRREIMRPARASARLALLDLMERARQRLGEESAEAWVFTRPAEDTDIRITPAEALRSRSHATGVWALLDQEAATRPPSWQPNLATVIEGGRKAG
jgi:hypothetical protein